MGVENQELGPLLRDLARDARRDGLPVRANTLERAANLAEALDGLLTEVAAMRLDPLHPVEVQASHARMVLTARAAQAEERAA